MKKNVAAGFLSFALGFLPSDASAAAIWMEDFTYADGSLTNVSSLWTTHSGTATPILVSGNTVAGMSAGAGSREDSNRLLDTTYSTGVLFTGFDLTLSTTPVGSAYFLHFKDTTTGFRGRVFLSEPTVTGFRLGLENDGGDNAAPLPTTSDLNLGATYRVVLGYDTAAGTSRLWVNNLNEASPTIEDTTPAATLVAISALGLRQGGSATATYTGLDIDNLITATDFVSAVPEPSVYALGMLGLATFCFLRRRK